jgi:lipopolysaccharide export system permease protein
MSILTRYIIKEHAGPFFFALSVIMFVFVTKFIVQYIGKIFGKGLALLTIFEFIYLNLAWMFALAVPMAVLVASLMAFGRLSADNEITILKSSGINIVQILRSSLLAAAVLAVLMTIYNDKILPDYNHRARLLYHSISQKKPTLELEEGIYLKLGNFNIMVDEIDKTLGDRISDSMLDPLPHSESSDKLKNITIFDYSAKDVMRIIIGAHGFLVFDKASERLVLTLFDGEIHEINTNDYSEYRRLKFTRNVFYIPAPEFVFKRTDDMWRGDREMNIEMMQKEISKQKEAIQVQLAEINRNLKKYLIDPDIIAKRLSDKPANITNPDSTNRVPQSRAVRKTQSLQQQILSSKGNIDHFEKQVYKYEVEVNKKFSIPFACIVFVLIGAPLGIKTRKGSFGVGFSLSIGFFLLYWACLIGGEELADRELVSPALAMWFPNIVVGAAGIILTYRTLKETTFIRWERPPKFPRILSKG